MRSVLLIFVAITGFLIIGAYGGYRATIWSFETHEGGDAFGPVGYFGFVAMIFLSLLSIVSAMISFGMWISERNHRKSRKHVLGLEE